MTRSVPTAVAIPSDDARATARSAVSALIEATKPGITRLVTITAAVGYALTLLVTGRELTLALLLPAFGMVLGVALAAGGANALNMWFEGGLDGQMDRTADRPIPSGRLTPKAVLLWGLLLSAIGVLLIAVTSNPAAAFLTLLSVASYVLVYTPLKTMTPWCTLVGAFPGALPPLIGSAAASTASGFAPMFEPVGLALFVLMVVWQIPHFLAIAWMYAGDYAKAGMRMLPVVDPTHRLTPRVTLMTATLLVPATFAPLVVSRGAIGTPYLLIASISGVLFALLALRLVAKPTRPNARAVFFASILHLPLLMVAMTAEAAIRTLLA
ncbi:MAG: heme o synthase [Phycisphaerales bacterium]